MTPAPDLSIQQKRFTGEQSDATNDSEQLIRKKQINCYAYFLKILYLFFKATYHLHIA